ncbi:MAG TPA: adenylate/guanylate cyclase domain-containing protein [Candidatus Limnocylindria bacterium]|nr:adenylate/guanylate cyclase domain-containing protein [Candidatus Limnocylindria bacterium]
MPASATDAPEPVAERRLVTVLFADLVGFTPFAEEHDAEDVRETLSRYFELAREIVQRYGGTVEKFIGDAVMAVWGAAVARENDAERAVRAALDLVAEVGSVAPMIQARAGVLTGEAVVTLGATDQGMVAGDLVNTASRLQSVAPAGVVLVGEATYRSSSQAITFEPAGEQTLKGKNASVPAWKALRVVAERGGRNRAEGLEAPFVGREAELRLLKDMLHATSRERRARLVSVVGVAGIGKSRLAWEFLKYLDGVLETIRYHAGRSPAYGEGITFWALGEMVRSRVRLTEGDDEQTTREKVAESVEEWIPDQAERRWVEQALLALLGVSEPPPGGRESLFAAWRTFFERIAARDPVTMVFEDLHWADSGLLDFIDHLLEWSRDLPIYIVTLARPELLERRPDWGAGKRNFSAITLGPLDDGQMRQLLAGLVPGLPEKTSEAIVSRAEGIPLYAVELVRVLVADGKLVQADGSYRPVGDLGDIAVPETLQGLISARLDALDPTDRSLLQDASVLGHTFTPVSLANITGRELSELESRLRGLVRREVLTYRVDPTSPEHGQYGFVQALIREVAYNTLAKAERRAKHLAAARWFESLGEEEIAGILAAHYLAAFRSSMPGPEADALAVQARIALKAAGDRAVQLGSHEQAMSFYDQALTVSSELVERVDLLLRGAVAATTAGRHDEAEKRARQALSFETEQGDPSSIAHATATLGRVLLNAYRTPEAIEVLEPAYQAAGDLDEPAKVELGGQMARAYFFLDQTDRAVAVADRVLAAAEHANLLPIVTDTLTTKGSALSNMGRLHEGTGLIMTALALAEKLGLADSIHRAAVNASATMIALDPRTSVEVARKGMSLLRHMGRSNNPILSTNFAEAALRIGEWRAALDELDAVLKRRLDPIDWIVVTGTRIVLSLLSGVDAGDDLAYMEVAARDLGGKDAESMHAEAVAWHSLTGGRFPEAYERWIRYAESSVLVAADAYAMAAHVALWQSDAKAARRAIECLEAMGQHGSALDTVTRALHAGVGALGGRHVEARANYRDILRELRELGLVLDEVLVAIDMVHALGGDDPDTRVAVARARQILDELGGGSPLKNFLEPAEAAAQGKEGGAQEEVEQPPVSTAGG